MGCGSSLFRVLENCPHFISTYKSKNMYFQFTGFLKWFKIRKSFVHLRKQFKKYKVWINGKNNFIFLLSLLDYSAFRKKKLWIDRFATFQGKNLSWKWRKKLIYPHLTCFRQYECSYCSQKFFKKLINFFWISNALLSNLRSA